MAFCNTRFPGATPSGVTDNVIPGSLNGNWDVWAQDQFQIGYQKAPYHAMYVVLDSIRNRGGLEVFPPRRDSLTPPGLFGPDFGHFQIGNAAPAAHTQESFGNLEVTPACGDNYPLGRIYHGNNMDSDLVVFLRRQEIQDPVDFNTSWLEVQHVDEFMSIVPDSSGTHGWKVLFADAALAVDLLLPGGSHPGVDSNLHIPKYSDPDPGKGFNVNTVSQLLGQTFGGATVQNYSTTIVQPHLNSLKGAVRSEFGLAAGDADFIFVPVLFFRNGGASAITPDLVNGPLYGNTFIAPDCFLHNPGGPEEDADSDFILDPGEDSNGNGRLDTLRDPFHIYFNNVLPSGVTGVHIDNWLTYHMRLGEVHCGSNTKWTIPTGANDQWWRINP